MIGKKIDELIEWLNSMSDIYLAWWAVFIFLALMMIFDVVKGG